MQDPVNVEKTNKHDKKQFLEDDEREFILLYMSVIKNK